MSEVEIHDATANEAIAAELVRCTLGQSRRLELRVDLAAAVARFTASVERFQEALRRTGVSVQRFTEAWKDGRR